MSMSRRLGQYVQTFSASRSVLGNSYGSVRVGLTNGSNFSFTPKDAHHHTVAAAPRQSAVTSVSTPLFESNLPKTHQIRTYAQVPSAPSSGNMLTSLCDAEINDFKTLIPENEDNKAYLEESGFVLTRDNDYAYLKKSNADGTEITIRFDLVEQMGEDQFDENENGEEDQNEEEEQEEEEEEQEEEEKEEEEQEEGEEGEEEENNTTPHEHPYEVSITRKVNGKDTTVTFGCFAAADGSYTVSGFYYGGFNEPNNPVDIGGTSTDFQDNILLFLQQFGVTEGLSFFIHDYVHNKKLTDYVHSFETLKQFISK